MRRDERQNLLETWAIREFGEDQATNVKQRAIRLLEEAIEAYQAANGLREMAIELVHYVFSRPKGDIKQELGGVGVTLLLLAQAVDTSADSCELDEIDRIGSKPPGHFSPRNDEKNNAGFKAD